MATKRTLGKKRLETISDDRLLQVRLCDLPVMIRGTVLESRIEQLHDELAARGLGFRPHCWLSDDWFSPDGVPGIAIPFYLADKRLMRLERQQVLEVEGGTHEWCMKLLRHEAGHAIDTAYRLRRRRKYREHFGAVSRPYPAYYHPKPYSKQHVLNLDSWYAQSHPVEDFAETFAVWLRPRSNWRVRYRDWPALKKLEYVDQLMTEIGFERPSVSGRRRVDHLSKLPKTLQKHYDQKRKRFGLNQNIDYYDNELCRIFADKNSAGSTTTAAGFLNRNRRELRRIAAERTGEYDYNIDQVIADMIWRCRELNLRLKKSERQSKREALGMLMHQAPDYLHRARHRVAM